MSKKIKVKKLEGSPYAIETSISGQGATATIVRAYNLQNPSEQLASKVMSMTENQNNEVCKTQLQMLKQLPSHPNLVNFKKIQISSQNNLYLIMEFCNGGNLQKYLFDCKYNLSQQKIWFFLKQFCEGYKVLYDHKVVHRDIKPQNILIHNGNFKIADFGLSKLIKHPQIIENVSFKGTPLYMAPQIPELKQGTSKIDIFSLGVLIYRMAFKGEYPFFDQGRKYRSVHQYFKQMKVRKLTIPKTHDRSQQLVNLIIKMLMKDKEQRIGWKEIFEHPKIVKAVRCERKKQMTTMQQFKRSLVFVNKSFTKVQLIESQPNSQIKNEEPNQTCLILQQAFNKNNKSSFQKLLYRYKLTYTLIEHVSYKIKNYLAKQKDLHKHIKKLMTKLIIQGLQFSLFVIDSLRNVSGEWQSFSSLQIVNFQNIFQNDRLILNEDLQKIISEQDNVNIKSHLKVRKSNTSELQQSSQSHKSKRIVKLSYEDLLYTFLTEYPEYPKQLRIELQSMVILLVDIYDLVIKFELNKIADDDKNILQLVEQAESNVFYEYLLDVQKMKQQELLTLMGKKGLIFK